MFCEGLRLETVKIVYRIRLIRSSYQHMVFPRLDVAVDYCELELAYILMNVTFLFPFTLQGQPVHTETSTNTSNNFSINTEVDN